MRTRIAAPPGLVRLVGEATGRPRSAQVFADILYNRSIAQCIPVRAPMASWLTGCVNRSDVLAVVDKKIGRDESRVESLKLLPPARRGTVYSRLCVDAVRSATDPIDRQLYRHFSELWKKEVRNVVKTPAALANEFSFDLRREAYCQRRFLTDLSLQKMAATDPQAVAWLLYADALGVRFKSRPQIFPIPHAYTAYYDFYATNPTPHFFSSDFIEESLSVLNSVEFEPYLEKARKFYVMSRDSWQMCRSTTTKKPPPYFKIEPAAYSIPKKTSLSSTATKLAAASQGDPLHKFSRILTQSRKLHRRSSLKLIIKNDTLFHKWLVED